MYSKKCYNIYILFLYKLQSTHVISKTKGLPEILRDFRTLTNHICRTEEKMNRTIKFHK